jgi:hypothetical protein
MKKNTDDNAAAVTQGIIRTPAARKSNRGTDDVSDREAKHHPRSLRPTLNLKRFAQNLIIEPHSVQLMLLLCSTFYTTSHRPADDPQLGYRLLPCWCPLVFEGEDYFGSKVIETYAGLTPLVCQLLTRHGYRLRWTAPRPAQLPPPDCKRLHRFDQVDRPVIVNVRGRDRALFRYTKGRVSPARIIAQIAAAWPELRIMVWATRISEAKRLTGELRKFYPDVTVHFSGNFPATRSRIVVSTYGQLGAPAVELEKRDIGFALNAAELLRSNVARQALRAAHRARFYGLLPDHEQLAPHDRDWVTALFGPDPISIPAHGRECRPVDVFFTKIAGGPPIASDADAHALNRNGIWHHPVRNRRIADLATALQRDDEPRIRHHLPDFSPSTPLPHQSGGRIAIVAGGIEHALALSKRLPDWPIVTDRYYRDVGLTDEQCLTLLYGQNPKLRTRADVIVTPAGLKRCGSVDTLIRADGGTGLPELPHKIATVPATRRPPGLLLIDMADRHHPQLRKWTRYRREAYVAAGWNVAGTQRQTALDQFLATRPKVELP